MYHASLGEQSLATRLCSETGWEDPELLACYSSEDAAKEIERIANVSDSDLIFKK